MCEDTKNVMQWLKKVFGQQTVPQFEVNTRTMKILSELMENSERRCREVELLIEDHQQKTLEYSSDGAHLQQVLLQGVGLQTTGLSKETLDLLAVLEGTAEVLKLRDTSLASYIPAFNKLTNDVSEAEKTERRLQQELSAVQKKMTDAIISRKKLQDDLMAVRKVQQVEAATAEERLLNMDFMKKKSRDLACRNKIAQEKLESRQMKESLTHEAILGLSEKVAALKEETAPLKKKLEPYSDLSPSPALARVKIEEAKRELASLDAQLEQKHRVFPHGYDFKELRCSAGVTHEDGFESGQAPLFITHQLPPQSHRPWPCPPEMTDAAKTNELPECPTEGGAATEEQDMPLRQETTPTSSPACEEPISSQSPEKQPTPGLLSMPCLLKELHRDSPSGTPQETDAPAPSAPQSRTQDDSDSSVCLRSPSSSGHLGDSDTLSSAEEVAAPAQTGGRKSRRSHSESDPSNVAMAAKKNRCQEKQVNGRARVKGPRSQRQKQRIRQLRQKREAAARRKPDVLQDSSTSDSDITAHSSSSSPLTASSDNEGETINSHAPGPVQVEPSQVSLASTDSEVEIVGRHHEVSSRRSDPVAFLLETEGSRFLDSGWIPPPEVVDLTLDEERHRYL
ncbi:hypothetical protein DNTS_004675, partial [Danionella cerebrum]